MRGLVADFYIGERDKKWKWAGLQVCLCEICERGLKFLSEGEIIDCRARVMVRGEWRRARPNAYDVQMIITTIVLRSPAQSHSPTQSHSRGQIQHIFLGNGITLQSQRHGVVLHDEKKLFKFIKDFQFLRSKAIRL